MSLHTLHHTIRNLFKTLVLRTKGTPLVLKDRILIVAPHPDDEVLGCGALIQTAVREGKDVRIILLTQGENLASNHTMSQSDLIARRRDLTMRSNASLGLTPDRITFLQYKDGGISLSNTEQTDRLRQLITSFAPQQVFVTSSYDVFPDHLNAKVVIQHLITSMQPPQPSAHGSHPTTLTSQPSIELYEYLVWFWFFFPFRSIPKLFGRSVRALSIPHSSKKSALSIYLDEVDSQGTYISGELPPEMISSLLGSKEFFLPF